MKSSLHDVGSFNAIFMQDCPSFGGGGSQCGRQRDPRVERVVRSGLPPSSLPRLSVRRQGEAVFRWLMTMRQLSAGESSSGQ